MLNVACWMLSFGYCALWQKNKLIYHLEAFVSKAKFMLSYDILVNHVPKKIGISKYVLGGKIVLSWIWIAESTLIFLRQCHRKGIGGINIALTPGFCT